MTGSTLHYLIVPGWQGSPDSHWQSHWQRVLPSASRVEQENWLLPHKARWVAALQRAIEVAPAPVILIGHSLGCADRCADAGQGSCCLAGGASRRRACGLSASAAEFCADQCSGAAFSKPAGHFAGCRPYQCAFWPSALGARFCLALSPARAQRTSGAPKCLKPGVAVWIQSYQLFVLALSPMLVKVILEPLLTG